MSRNGNRWYVLGRVVPLADGKIVAVAPGTEYEFVGWCRTKEAMQERRAKLDRAGRQGIHVFSPSREQAARDAMACYGVTVRGYISPEDKRVGRMIVKAAVMREIFCPFTGVVLDMRRAVVIVTPTRSFVCTGAHWDEAVAKVGGLDALRAALAGKLGRAAEVDVYDGRELCKR